MHAKKTATTLSEMVTLARGMQSGDKLELIFADRQPEGGLSWFITDIIDAGMVSMSELSLIALRDVALGSIEWHGFRTYQVTIISGFDAERFIERAIIAGLLESMTLR